MSRQSSPTTNEDVQEAIQDLDRLLLAASSLTPQSDLVLARRGLARLSITILEAFTKTNRDHFKSTERVDSWLEALEHHQHYLTDESAKLDLTMFQKPPFNDGPVYSKTSNDQGPDRENKGSGTGKDTAASKTGAKSRASVAEKSQKESQIAAKGSGTVQNVGGFREVGKAIRKGSTVEGGKQEERRAVGGSGSKSEVPTDVTKRDPGWLVAELFGDSEGEDDNGEHDEDADGEGEMENEDDILENVELPEYIEDTNTRKRKTPERPDDDAGDDHEMDDEDDVEEAGASRTKKRRVGKSPKPSKDKKERDEESANEVTGVQRATGAGRGRKPRVEGSSKTSKPAKKGVEKVADRDEAMHEKGGDKDKWDERDVRDESVQRDERDEHVRQDEQGQEGGKEVKQAKRVRKPRTTLLLRNLVEYDTPCDRCAEAVYATHRGMVVQPCYVRKDGSKVCYVCWYRKQGCSKVEDGGEEGLEGGPEPAMEETRAAKGGAETGEEPSSVGGEKKPAKEEGTSNDSSAAQKKQEGVEGTRKRVRKTRVATAPSTVTSTASMSGRDRGGEKDAMQKSDSVDIGSLGGGGAMGTDTSSGRRQTESRTAHSSTSSVHPRTVRRQSRAQSAPGDAMEVDIVQEEARGRSSKTSSANQGLWLDREIRPIPSRRVSPAIPQEYIQSDMYKEVTALKEDRRLHEEKLAGLKSEIHIVQRIQSEERDATQKRYNELAIKQEVLARTREMKLETLEGRVDHLEEAMAPMKTPKTPLDAPTTNLHSRSGILTVAPQDVREAEGLEAFMDCLRAEIISAVSASHDNNSRQSEVSELKESLVQLVAQSLQTQDQRHQELIKYISERFERLESMLETLGGMQQERKERFSSDEMKHDQAQQGPQKAPSYHLFTMGPLPGDRQQGIASAPYPQTTPLSLGPLPHSRSATLTSRTAFTTSSLPPGGRMELAQFGSRAPDELSEGHTSRSDQPYGGSRESSSLMLAPAYPLTSTQSGFPVHGPDTSISQHRGARTMSAASALSELSIRTTATDGSANASVAQDGGVTHSLRANWTGDRSLLTSVASNATHPSSNAG